MKLRKILFPFIVGLALLISAFSLPQSSYATDTESLILSEYIEGSSYNKALEIYNGTGQSIDLSDYSIVQFTNGASQSPDDGKFVSTIPLTGTLQNDEVFVLAHASADQEVLEKADVTGDSYFYGFNGDDTLVLFKNYNKDTRQGLVIDSLGKVGEDPGTSWSNNQVSTQNATLVRKETITDGDSYLYDSFDPSEEWIALPQDTFTNIGKYDPVQAREQKGQYTAVVDYIVDGDTIHIENSVLGTDTVRYINIDTPETYHLESFNQDLITLNEDHSQKYHGEKAKEALKDILQPGDEIILKVGEEATDQYGRLLAQVIRKEDGMNTNLALVQLGYAVTYFISPIGNEDTYNQYQDAVQYALDHQRGIWDEDTPLLELPFEFRAREQDKGLTKYVGNSDSNEYVRPKDWEDVPVNQRIFFWTENDAIQAGYTPDFDREHVIADARYASVGTDVTVQGIVTATVQSGNKTNYYIQDQTAGIVVRTDDVDAEIGDEIRASGETSEYYGLLQVVTSDVTITDEDADSFTPTLIQASDIDEDVESELVLLEDVTIESVDDQNNYQAKTSSGTFTIDSNQEYVEVGHTYDSITGVVDYNYGEYKLLPRFEEDVIENIGIIDIEEARQADLSTRVKIRGIVTAKFKSGNKTNYYIQDETAGIVVRAESFGADLGDRIQAKARTEEYFDLLELQPTPDNVYVVKENVGVPEPKNIESEDLGEDLEGQLVAIQGVRVINKDDNHNYTARDDEGTFVIDSDTDLVKVDNYYDKIIGVVDYNYGEYKLLPRFSNDIMNEQEQEDPDYNYDIDLFSEYLDGDESLTDVTNHIIGLYQSSSSKALAQHLEAQLSEFIETNGNTDQHIDSTVHHIMTSLSKLERKTNDIEKWKIEHELSKLIKKDSKKNKGPNKN